MHHEVRKQYALEMALEVMLKSTLLLVLPARFERNKSCIPSYFRNHLKAVTAPPTWGVISLTPFPNAKSYLCQTWTLYSP